jgi:hypothetical protein
MARSLEPATLRARLHVYQRRKLNARACFPDDTSAAFDLELRPVLQLFRQLQDVPRYAAVLAELLARHPELRQYPLAGERTGVKAAPRRH